MGNTNNDTDMQCHTKSTVFTEKSVHIKDRDLIFPHNNRTNEVNKRFIICHFLDSMHANSVIKGERHALLSRTHRIRTTAMEIAKF